MANRLDDNGTLYLLSKLLLLFVRQQPGKGLSTNDLTNELLAKINSTVGFSGDYDDLANKPNLAVYQTAAQVSALIEAALSAIDTEIFLVVAALPAANAANTNKIYILSPDMSEWRSDGTAWDRVGAADVDLTGYYNESNLTPITNAEIDAMIAGLTV